MKNTLMMLIVDRGPRLPIACISMVVQYAVGMTNKYRKHLYFVIHQYIKYGQSNLNLVACILCAKFGWKEITSSQGQEANKQMTG